MADFLFLLLLKVIGDYVLVEVLQGFRNDRDYQNAKNILLTFPCFDVGGKEIVLQGTKYYRTLSKKGITIRKTIDTMIASFCIVNKFTLLHNDKDFEPFEKYLKLKTYQK